MFLFQRPGAGPALLFPITVVRANRVLLQAIGDEQPVCPDDDAEPVRPTVH